MRCGDVEHRLPGEVTTRKPMAIGDTSDWGMKQFMSHAAIAAAPEVYLPSGELTFTVTMTVHGAPLFSNKAAAVPVTAPVPPSLGADMAAALKHGPPGDVVLVCADGERVAAHSLVLSARSTVFAALLSRMDGKAELAVAPEIDGATVRRMLDFMYTDQLEPACVEEAGHLLNAADHYHLPRMLAICEHALVTGLDVANATHTLAHQHSMPPLKRAALQFVLAHPADVMQSAGWAHMRDAHPVLVEEAFAAASSTCISPRRSRQRLILWLHGGCADTPNISILERLVREGMQEKAETPALYIPACAFGRNRPPPLPRFASSAPPRR